MSFFMATKMQNTILLSFYPPEKQESCDGLSCIGVNAGNSDFSRPKGRGQKCPQDQKIEETATSEPARNPATCPYSVTGYLRFIGLEGTTSVGNA
jgi:hypothetical protein